MDLFKICFISVTDHKFCTVLSSRTFECWLYNVGGLILSRASDVVDINIICV